ncbi:hypothetical protein CPC08DRAFT_595900, partial [Agrocybe pediades]
ICSECCERNALWTCRTCFGRKLYCALCLRKSHQDHLYHAVRRWNGNHWEHAALWQVGATLNLGHSGQQCPGQACPSEEDMEAPAYCFQPERPGPYSPT